MLAIAAVSLWSTGCGSVDGVERGPSDRNYITPDEVASAITTENAYLLVQRLRPLWLHERGPKSFHFDRGVIVYEGEMLYGNAESLRFISTLHIQALRYLTPAQANLIHGTGHPHGAIVVTVKGES